MRLFKSIRWTHGLIAVALLLALVAASTALAAVWTDQSDYSPGATVTIHGDNSDGAGYLPGETVNVDVSGPNGYQASCQGTADGSGAWSCQVTLWSGERAIGQYTYTATGQSSGVSQSGTFTDNPCPASQSGLTSISPSLLAFTESGTTTRTYGVATSNQSPSGGIPGVIELCVYHNGAVSSATALYDAWTASTPTTDRIEFTRPGGNPTNIPLNGATVNVGQATYSSQPTSETIVAHINWAAQCPVGTNTCFKILSPQSQEAQPPTVSKDANGSYDDTFSWTITKSVDNTLVKTAGGAPATFNYVVSVSHGDSQVSNVKVNGTITVNNPNSANVTLDSITDQLSNGTNCTVTGGSLTLPPGNTSFSYTCNLSGLPSGDVTNTATASWSEQTLSDGSHLAAGSANFTTGTISFTANEIDECVTVNDTNANGPQGVQVCAGVDPNPKTFTYSATFSDPAGTCTSHDNTATFTTNDTGATGSASQTVTDCQGADLVVTKDATPSFTRTFHWGITKDVDKTEIDIADGGTATFNYSVSVTHDSGTDSNWQVNGTIHVTNPNDWEAITANVTDAVDNGGNCTVTGGTGVSVPAGGSVNLPYTCTYSSAPSPSSGTNTATATWDSATFFTPDGSATGTSSFAFTTPTTIVDGSVSVSDTLGGFLGTVSYTDPSPTTFTYSHTFTGDPGGTCTNHNNTATFTTNTTGTTGSASQTVKVCVGLDLTVSKTATPSFKRTYNWNITKSVDKTTVKQIGGTATFNYTIVVNETGFTDSDWQVAGTITVNNPNDWEAITANVADAVDNGGSCTVSSGTVTVSASGSATVNYTCTYSSAPSPSSGTNTATASWDASAFHTPDGSASGSAGFAFISPTTLVNKTVTVSDSFAGTLGTVTATDSQPFASATFTYSRTITIPQFGCQSYTNTATIVETGQSSSVTVTVCGPAQTGALTMGFWKNTNGQNLVKYYCNNGANNLGTYLAGLGAGSGPFSDAPTSCTSLKTYVYNILNGASATNMNKMLKAQMLATALDVWFSGPGWTSTQIGGVKPPSKFLSNNNLGTFNMDTTAVCPMVDNLSTGTATCLNNTPSTDAVAAGAVPTSPMSMQALLNFAATVDVSPWTNGAFTGTAANSTWYGTDRTKQEILKNIFDQFNNQLAFGSF